MNKDAQLEWLCLGAEEVIGKEELANKLAEGVPLRVKAGFDPTAPNLHLGHSVLLNKLKQFQDLGHQVLFLVGDFTARIGDPTGKSIARPPLTEVEVAENAKTYIQQVAKVLDVNNIQVVFNSTWMSALSSQQWVSLTSHYTVARMLERDDFQKRFAAQQAIGLHEFMYPLIQGYDSVALNADLEIGGTDQKFNLLMGRHLQKQYHQSPQAVLLLPLLEGIDGQKKMSKSIGNTIDVNDSPGEMFSKLVSIPDHLMWRYFTLLSHRSFAEIAGLQQAVAEGVNPRDVKMKLACELISRFHGEEAVHGIEQAAGNRMQLGAQPTDVEKIVVSVASSESTPITAVLRLSGLVKNANAARDVLYSGVVCVDGQIVDAAAVLSVGRTYLLQVGKKKIANVCLVHETKGKC
jgi:tyrosyl-tRNA synthetase